jgi:hypothetical protein
LNSIRDYMAGRIHCKYLQITVSQDKLMLD